VRSRRARGDGALEVVGSEIGGPARTPLEVTEPDAVLAHRETQRIAVTVEIDAQQLLRVARRLALHPQCLARPRPVDPPPLVHGARQGFGRAPHQSQRAPPLVAYDRGPDTALRPVI